MRMEKKRAKKLTDSTLTAARLPHLRVPAMKGTTAQENGHKPVRYKTATERQEDMVGHAQRVDSRILITSGWGGSGRSQKPKAN